MTMTIIVVLFYSYSIYYFITEANAVKLSQSIYCLICRDHYCSISTLFSLSAVPDKFIISIWNGWPIEKWRTGLPIGVSPWRRLLAKSWRPLQSPVTVTWLKAGLEKYRNLCGYRHCIWNTMVSIYYLVASSINDNIISNRKYKVELMTYWPIPVFLSAVTHSIPFDRSGIGWLAIWLLTD